MTSTGLQFAIEKHIRLVLYIDLQAPYIIIPHGGIYTGTENVLVANLGRLKIYSSGKRAQLDNIKKMYAEGLDREDMFLRLKEQCYDTFVLELKDLHILMAQGEEDWKTVIKESKHSDMHLLRPLSLSINFSRCLITDDPRFPQNKLVGKLPSIDIRVSDARLLLVASLGTSIPLPSSDVPELEPLSVNYTKTDLSLVLSFLFLYSENWKKLQFNAANIQRIATQRNTNKGHVTCSYCRGGNKGICSIYHHGGQICNVRYVSLVSHYYCDLNFTC